MNEPNAGPEPAGVLVVFAMAAAAILFGGAQLASILASGHALHVSTAVALRCAVVALGHASNPAGAWPRSIRGALPGPFVYWASTGVVLAAASVVAVAIARLVRDVRGQSRTRLGVDASARLARPGELAPLVLRRAAPGRFLLGRVGRRLIATEGPKTKPTARWRRRAATRGRRSSVAMIGPTRCGKTAATITGLLEWHGPAILSSVKSDLMAATIAWRRRLGEVRVFDPTGSTPEPTYGWTPLRDATTVTGAQKAARALLDAGPRARSEDLDFFLHLAEQLLWPLFLLAANSGLAMRDVVTWIQTQESPLEDHTTLSQILRAPTQDVPATQRHATLEATRALAGIWALDKRTRSSAYATAQTLIVPWTDPGVAEASDYDEIDLQWLLAGENTLYLCAPLHEQERLAPVFGGLLGDLINQAYERVGHTNEELPTTLLVLDEAANTPTRWLPHVASTCAGLGLLLVTIWQSKAQLDAIYGPLADSVLTNHATKLIFSGVSDLPTLDYAARLVGDEEIVRRATSIDQEHGRRTLNLSHQPAPLLPGHVLRQSNPGNALLVHGTLPPAHLRTRPYYQERRLRNRASQPISAHGRR
jgi:type IV secretion system protein VirD4